MEKRSGCFFHARGASPKKSSLTRVIDVIFSGMLKYPIVLMGYRSRENKALDGPADYV